jgi:hypothetical protein
MRYADVAEELTIGVEHIERGRFVIAEWRQVAASLDLPRFLHGHDRMGLLSEQAPSASANAQPRPSSYFTTFLDA